MTENKSYGERLREEMLHQETPELRSWSDRIFKEQNAIDTARTVADLRYRFPQELRDEIEDLGQRLKLLLQESPPDLDEARRLLDQIHELEMQLKMNLQKPRTPLSKAMNPNLTTGLKKSFTSGERKYEMLRKSSFVK